MFKEQSGSQCSWNSLNKRIIAGDKMRGNGGESTMFLSKLLGEWS